MASNITLSDGVRQNLLAMQSEMAQATDHIFRQLNDADLKFGYVRDEQNLREDSRRRRRKSRTNRPYGCAGSFEETSQRRNAREEPDDGRKRQKSEHQQTTEDRRRHERAHPPVEPGENDANVKVPGTRKPLIQRM
jgi:hypothetical protein